MCVQHNKTMTVFVLKDSTVFNHLAMKYSISPTSGVSSVGFGARGGAEGAAAPRNFINIF